MITKVHFSLMNKHLDFLCHRAAAQPGTPAFNQPSKSQPLFQGQGDIPSPHAPHTQSITHSTCKLVSVMNCDDTSFSRRYQSSLYTFGKNVSLFDKTSAEIKELVEKQLNTLTYCKVSLMSLSLFWVTDCVVVKFTETQVSSWCAHTNTPIITYI